MIIADQECRCCCCTGECKPNYEDGEEIGMDLSDLAWTNTEVRAHIRKSKHSLLRSSRTGNGDGWSGRDNGPIFRNRMKRIQSHKVRRAGKEIIKEQLSLVA
jgi:hypothetical protein